MMDPSESDSLVEFGPFTLDKSTGTLNKRGTPIRLRGMPLRILQHLVERHGEVVSRGELKSLLWNGTAFGDFESGLNTAMNVVRRSLGDSAEQARYIETIAGQGYRFVAPIRPAATVREEYVSTAEAETDSITNEVRENGKVAKPTSRWVIGAAFLTLAALGIVAWWAFQPKPPVLLDGATPSASREANDQYNLAMNFLAIQNDIPRARQTFERAIQLDGRFASAHLQRALAIVIEIYNGYANDDRALYQAEEDIHQAEHLLPASDPLLLAAQAGVYLAQSRLDRVPSAKLEAEWQPGGNPVWLVILRMLREQQTESSIAILRGDIERNPLFTPTRMFLGELLRLQGDSESAIRILERVVQQGPRHPTAAWFLTMAYLDHNQPERSRALLEAMRPEFDNNFMWRHAWAIVLAAEGKREDAFAAMDEETLKFAHLTWTVTSTTADFYALQGDPAKAIEWLQLAISRGDERVAYFRRNPRLATLRSESHFQSLLKSVEERRIISE